MDTPVVCWVAGLAAAVITQIIDGDPLRVVGSGLIAYGLTLYLQSLYPF